MHQRVEVCRRGQGHDAGDVAKRLHQGRQGFQIGIGVVGQHGMADGLGQLRGKRAAVVDHSVRAQLQAVLADIADFIAAQGRIALIDDPQTLDIVPLKRKSLSVHWEFMFTRPLLQTADMVRQQDILRQVAHLAEQGNIISTRTRSLGSINAANLRQAHALLESGQSIGKITLSGF